jgi:hypothetical protein
LNAHAADIKLSNQRRHRALSVSSVFPLERTVAWSG